MSIAGQARGRSAGRGQRCLPRGARGDRGPQLGQCPRPGPLVTHECHLPWALWEEDVDKWSLRLPGPPSTQTRVPWGHRWPRPHVPSVLVVIKWGSEKSPTGTRWDRNDGRVCCQILLP